MLTLTVPSLKNTGTETMKVWKKQSVKYLKNGKRCTKETKGARKIIIESKRFYGTLRTASGKRKQIPLTEDRKTSETLLHRLQGEADKRRALGIADDDQNGQRTVDKALPEYLSHLTMKGNTPEYVRMCKQRLEKLTKATKAKTVSDLDSGKVLRTLSKWKIALGTKNHYIRAAKGFAKWLVRNRQLKADPFIDLQCFNAKTDRRRVRRPFTDEELSVLLKDTQTKGKRYRGDGWQFLPRERVMLYRLAFNTGLRAKELSTLTVSAFDLEKRIVKVSASNTKNRQDATLPLSEALCNTLSHFFSRLRGKQLFPGNWYRKRMAGKMLKRDLKRCGIAIKDANGKTLDFHSFRYTFISNLAKGNVHPSQAQRLARHSTISLTMDVYTQLDVEDLRDAVDGLPSL